jgi:hypothetical protein
MIKRLKQVGNGEGFLEAKRFYYPAVLYSDCPECGKECEVDGSEMYISYGSTGQNTVNFYCHSDEGDECSEWDEEIMVEIKVSIA